MIIEDAARKERDERGGKDGRGRRPDCEQTAFVDSTVFFLSPAHGPGAFPNPLNLLP